MQVEVRVEDFEEVAARLESLPGVLAETGYGKASRKAANVLRKHVRRAAPRSRGRNARYKKEGQRQGDLRRSIKVRGERYSIPTRRGLKRIPNGFSVVFIDFRSKIAPYAGIVMYGTEKTATGSYRGKGRRRAGGKRAPGKLYVPGRGPKRGEPYTDFFNRGYDAGKGEMFAVAVQELDKAFDVAVEKIRSRRLTRRETNLGLAGRL